jgi:polysaccharide biosynthesis protein PslG
MYCAALGSGIKPLFILWTSPPWASTNTNGCSWSPCRVPSRPEFDGELQEFAELAARRYPEAVFEFWNEPNLIEFWGTPANATRYTELLRAAYRGVKNGSPDTPVLGGALSNNSHDGSGNLGLETFLRRMYQAGAGNYMDGISFHPYPVWVGADRELSKGNFESIDEVIAEQGELGRRHIVATEVGASTAYSDPIISSEQHNQQQQWEALWRTYGWARERPYADGVVFHTLIAGENPGYGWVTRDGAGSFWAQPVYCNFAQQLGNPFNCGLPIPLS